jgi:hypothetical protein
MSRVRFLESFSYLEGLSDKGVGVSEKAKELNELMNNPEKLEDERTKSEGLKKKLSKGGFHESNYDPKYGGFSSHNDYDDLYSATHEHSSGKKSHNYEKDREISFKKEEEIKKEIKREELPPKKEPKKETKPLPMADDFDFIETVPQKQNKPQTQQINLLDIDSFQPTENTKAPNNTLNLLEDLNFQNNTKNEDSPFDLSQALKPSKEKMSPVHIAMEAEYGKKKSPNPKEGIAFDEFDDFKAADTSKKEEKAKEKDIWNQYEDIMDIGDLSEPKKAEPKSICLIRKGCDQVVLVLINVTINIII